MTTARTTKLGLALLLMACFATAPAQAGEIKNVMKDMKTTVKAALASNNMADFNKHFTQLQNDVAKASKLPLKKDQPTYDKGLKELQQQLDVVSQAVKANNLAAAKDALQKTDPIKKHYHKQLDI
ncbi:cytochrome b562 [Vogesella sp. LIG4]|uniref:cytochrome b562 n=1 Tax=Vogesella sp. LIG4 TaxID=1192162 RepID=UPI00081FCAFF|nr:cytochrome b562 [Vogesella sp. LIG4]SCK11588.1 soluble cytochrome b562 [Vogesella sp. LIG4]